MDFDVLSGSEIMFFEKKVEIYGKKLFKKKIGEKFELISHKSLVLMQYKTFVKQFLRVWDFFEILFKTFWRFIEFFGALNHIFLSLNLPTSAQRHP